MEHAEKIKVFAPSAHDLPDSPLMCPREVALGDRGVFAVHGDPLPADALTQNFTFGRGESARAKRWSNRTKTLGELTALLSNHVESADKDGPAIMCGQLIGNTRTKAAVKSMCMVGLDIDSGSSLAEAKEALASFGHLAILATTHSHGKSITGIPRRAFDTFAEKRNMAKESDLECLAVARAYLLDKGYRAEALQSAAYAGLEQTADGWQHFVTHAGLDKFRVYVPLASPYVFTEHGKTEVESWARWEGIVLSLAEKLSLNIDRACLDPSRLWFSARHKKGAAFESHVFRGPLLRFEDIPLPTQSTASANPFEAAGNALSGDDKMQADEKWRFAPSVLDLKAFTARDGHRFELAEAIRAHAPDRIRNDAGGKLTCECPFEEDHSTQGGEGFFCQDASENPGEAYRAFCSHNTCKGRKKWEFVAKMFADDVLPESVIAPGSPFMAEIVEEEDQTADGVEAERLGAESTAERLHAILAAIDGFSAETTDAAIDAIFAELVALNVGKAQGEQIVAKIVKRTGRKKKEVEARLKRAWVVAKIASKSTVFETEEEGIAAMNEVAATVLAGNTFRVILETPDDEDTSFRLLPPADASHYFAPWRFVGGDGEKPALVPLFPVWKASGDHRHYENIVFDPSGRIPNPKHYNVWRGLKIAPPDRTIRHDNEPGDWRLLARHLFSLICNGDADHFEWLMAWNADLYQDPAHKKGVALVLNSPERGTGKSTLGNVHQRILGRHAQKFSGADALTKQFNAPLAEALFVIGEEVLFSGDRKGVNAIKAAITEDTIQLERKRVDAIQIKSHARYLLISNEKRSAPAETGTERRYFILKVGAQYAKTGDPTQDERSREYFDALYREIDNGGAEAFLESLLKFETSRFDLRNPPKTQALAEQIEANLQGEGKWLFDVLATGAFVGTGGAILDEMKGWENGPVEVERSIVFESYNAVVSPYGQRQAVDSQIGAFLSEHIPALKTRRPRINGAPQRVYQFPPLPECIAAFERVTGVRLGLNESRLVSAAVVDVNPSDDPFYEAGRLLEIDAVIAMLLGPDEENLLRHYDKAG